MTGVLDALSLLTLLALVLAGGWALLDHEFGGRR